MRIDIFTIFPKAVDDFASAGILGRARRDGVVDLRVHDLRDGAEDQRRTIDDAPYGGGAGMVLMAEPLFSAIENVENNEGLPRPLFLCSPGGRKFDQELARELADSKQGFSLLCGRYEGVDQRVVDNLVDGEISIGDVVLAGGEIAALLITEAVTRLVPGTLGSRTSLLEESFSSGLLEYPQYTRPSSFRGWEVPEVLRKGDHKEVAKWRQIQSLIRTLKARPDLIGARGGLSQDEVRHLANAGEMQVLIDSGYDDPSR